MHEHDFFNEVVLLGLVLVGGVVVATFAALAAILAPGAIRRKRQWGAYFVLPRCVRCGEPATKRRRVSGELRHRYACSMCGVVTDEWGAPITDWPPPAPWTVLPAADKPRLREAHPEGVTAPDTRTRVPSNGYHEGRRA
jgi:hypothetical protein